MYQSKEFKEYGERVDRICKDHFQSIVSGYFNKNGNPYGSGKALYDLNILNNIKDSYSK